MCAHYAQGARLVKWRFLSTSGEDPPPMDLVSPMRGDLTRRSAKIVFEAAKALTRRSERFLTVATERRKIAWLQRRIAAAGGRRSAL